MSKRNGFLPGWPPFHQFRKEMADMAGRAVEEKLKPITEDIKTLKNSLVSHISNTKVEFKKTSNRFGQLDAEFKKASNRFGHLDKDMKQVKKALSNHITDANKKIDRLDKTVNSKLNTLLKFSGKSHVSVKKERTRPSKIKTKKS